MEIKQGGHAPEQLSLLVNIWALEGRGKTTFALTFPSPLFFFNCDRQCDYLFGQLPETTQIFYESAIPEPGETLTQEVARHLLSKFTALMNLGIQTGKGSIIIDNGARLWDIIKGAILNPGEADKRAWEVPNNYFSGLLLQLEECPLQVAITHPGTSVWESMSKESGLLRPDAFKHIRASETHEVFLFVPGWEDNINPVQTSAMALAPTAQLPVQHWARIWRDKYNTSLVGQVFPQLDFKTLYFLSTHKVWEGECWKP